MSERNTIPGLQFLSGGGEMVRLMREKDWSQTAVGDPSTWPQSLRTTLSIILHSKFPMFLWWGKELTCFYNDAYRPSLGKHGKHPSILGEAAETAWAEIWPIIKPLIDQVLEGGEATWSEDQLIPIYRNGQLEDVYWTFSYSPVNDESNQVAGVLVTCNETTEKVRVLSQAAEREKNLTDALHQVEESDKRFRNTVKQAPLGITILRGRNFVPEMANETYLQLVDRTEKELVGKPLFESLPEVKDIVEPLLNGVMDTGTTFHASELSVSLKRYGQEALGYFNLVYHPLREENGEVTGIMVVATEVTESVKAKHALTESEKQFRNLVMQSPIPMTIFMGPDFTVEMANSIMFEKIWRKKKEEVLGKSILEVFPELKTQKYEELLNRVYTTGKAHTEIESVAYIQGNDGLKKFYLDFEYAPLFDTEKKVAGLIITVNDVTERVEARLKIEENERRLNIVIDSSELGTWEWDLVTDEMTYSKRYLEIFNYHDDPSMVQHEKHLAHIHPDDKPTREKAMRVALETGALQYQARIIWADGSTHWMEAKGKVFYDALGKPVKMIGTIRDISNDKNREQELRENEQRFRLLADSMPQHIWTADTEGNLNYFNKSVFDYSGFTQDEMVKKGWLDIVHPDDRPANIAAWTEAISTGNDFIFEHRFRRHDGEYRWQLSRAIPQRDEKGNIQMWVGTSTDIEDQKIFTSELEKQVEERTRELVYLNETLAQSEQRYHLMVEEVEDYAILYLNREGIVENWNKGAEKIKGYQAEEIIGKSFSIFYPEQERINKLPETLLQRAASEGKATHEGYRIRKDGTLLWASVAITAVHDDEGNVIGFSKVTHDLTDKKAAEDKIRLNAEQLAQKNKDLEKMNAELQSFAYVSSHDLQEPLRKIQTFASRILSKEAQNLSENAKDYFKRMQDAAGRMQTLIQDLLAYSRTSTTDRVFEKTDLGKIAEEVKMDIKETNPEKNVTIDVSNMCEVSVIPFQIRQLLYNLVGNAIKFAKPGVAPHVVISSKTVKGTDVKTEKLNPKLTYCHITVTDNGIGFDPQYRNRIFEVFQRLHGKDEYSGTGIGLAIVKKIVDNHNGAISATSEIGKGARFDIYLPM